MVVVEKVCTGNGGRSPQGETLMKHEVRIRGLEGKIIVYSSGTGVEATENLEYPMHEIIGAIEVGLIHEVYREEAHDLAQEIVENKVRYAELAEKGDEETRKKIKYVFNFLNADEVAKRNMVLLEIGLAPVGHFHQQTVVRDDVDLILPMKESNAKQVRKIYEGSGRNPRIIPICEYAGIEGTIADPFGKPIEVWRKTRDQIREAVVKSVDRMIKEYKLS